MKYIVLLTDGMADERYDELGGKSPLEAAQIPFLHELARQGEVGLVKTVPLHMAPGSDVANLALLGYDPERYHSGRSSLEAISMGVDLADTDVTFRCNLVTLSGEPAFGDRTMIDYSAGEIPSEESRILMRDLAGALNTEMFSFFGGISYRHLLLWHEGRQDLELTPPHDITGQPVREHLPRGAAAGPVAALLEQGAAFLADHPVNRDRRARGLRPANGIWFWGMATKPLLDPFREKFGLSGAVISAVDLIKGIGIAAGMKSIDVEGATGNLHTNFEGKREAANKVLEDGADFVYLHLEAPDECGHQGNLAGKIEAIEQIERRVAVPLVEELRAKGTPFRLMVLPDHATPVRTRTHNHEPVPYLIYDSTRPQDHPEQAYTEEAGRASGQVFDAGWALTAYFLQAGTDRS